MAKKQRPLSSIFHLPSSLWNGILRSERHPRHATRQSRRRQPHSFRKTMREHRFFGVNRAGRPEPAPDETIRNRFEDEPVTADDDLVVQNNRDLRPRWLRPIA